MVFACFNSFYLFCSHFFCLFHKISFWVAAMAVTLQTRQFETKLKCFGSIISRGQLAVYYSLLWFVCSTFGPDFVYFFDGLMVSLRQLPNLAMLDNQPGPLPNCFDKSSLPLCVISVAFFLSKIIDLWFSAKFSYFQQQEDMIKQMSSDSIRKAIQEVQLLLESQWLGWHIEMLCCRVSPLDE